MLDEGPGLQALAQRVKAIKTLAEAAASTTTSPGDAATYLRNIARLCGKPSSAEHRTPDEVIALYCSIRLLSRRA